ncbi:MAG TPA: hypothetical protein VGK58_00250 [Lacipirellulaceae bacterium]
MIFLIVLISLGALAAIVAAVGWWILWPIDRAAKSRRASIQFSIGDFLCLFIVLQIPLLASHFLAIETDVDADRRSFWIITLITWIIAPLIWFICARSLSKAQVRNGVHRLTFLGLIVPFVYYAFLPYLFLSVSISLLFSGVHPRRTDSSNIVFIAWVAITLVFFLCGLFTRWMLSQVANDAPPGSRSNGESEPTPVA